MELLENNQDIFNSNNYESDSLQTLSPLDFNDRDLFQTSLIDESNYLVEIEAEEYHNISGTDSHEWSLIEEDTSSNQALHATPDIGFQTNRYQTALN